MLCSQYTESEKLFVFFDPRYRKVVSNNCTAGVSTEYTAKRQQCPIQAPKGLHLVTSEGTLTATLGSNVTFLVFLEEVSCVLFKKPLELSDHEGVVTFRR